MNNSERLKQYWQDVRNGLRNPPQRKADAPTKRKVRCISNWVRSGEVIVVVYPHGEIGFREPGKRAEYKLGLPEAFRHAVTITSLKIGARVKALRREGRTLAQARKQARKELL